MASDAFLYPNVTSVPVQGGMSENQSRVKDSIPGEFDAVLNQNLEQVKAPLKFSAHASQRLKDRKIALDSNLMSKVRDAVDKAEAKGIEDTLILTPEAALIVSVKNRTVVTALDRASMSGNVFTNIDGAVVV